ncbi:fungal-specific transcription factor domain-containing protein [Mycena polygramma]|nr:fungal-specific transcription factor domain-containing protein [Mycena polygramma]
MPNSNVAESSAGMLNKDGSISKMRAHRGNVPTLAQSKVCPQCPAKFTRSTHLTRHMKNHTNERQHRCQQCSARFTRGDLLARHRKNCEGPKRLRSCISCTESKVKCDRNDPQCSRCIARGRDCLYAVVPRKDSPLDADTSPLSDFPVSEPSTTARALETETSFLPLDSLSEQLSDLPAMAAHTDTVPTSDLVHSHLSAAYEDCFQPLFNDVFSRTGLTPLDDFSFPFPPLEEMPLQNGAAPPWFQELMVPQISFPGAEREQRPLLSDLFGHESKAADLKYYLYLFFNAFSTQIPIVHGPTFRLEDKPTYLLKSIKACGAIFVRTHHASTYINDSLAAARDGLAHAFTRTSTDHTEQVDLLVAVVLLQSIGLWHPKPDERATSSLYHTMLVTMIRRAGLISKNSAWTPSKSDNLETMWREWAFHEMTKRALLLSYLHDSCQPIYFGLSSSYIPGEVTLHLPCEDALWKAESAEEWFSILQEPSLLVSAQQRLLGPDLNTNLASMNDMQFTPTFLPSFAHFVLIHSILRDLFAACSQTMASDSPRVAQAIISAQCALHNWLQSWTMNQVHRPNTVPSSFFENVLQFYWLGQVTILAYQEGLPPFNSTGNEPGEVQFKMVKRWLRRIQVFIDEGDGESTLFWDELMKIRLMTWQLEYDAEGGLDDHDGLLGFFAT